jgi:acyl carrier protein
MEADAETLEKITRLIAIEMNVPEEVVRKAGSLRKELGMDSVAAASLLFAIEEEFSILLDLTNVEDVDSPTELASLVASARRQSGQ